jgi:hypothetical protein
MMAEGSCTNLGQKSFLLRKTAGGAKPSYLHEPPIFSQLLTRANEPELKSQAGPAYRVVNKEKLAHPTRFERVTFAFGGQRSIQLSYGCLPASFS